VIRHWLVLALLAGAAPAWAQVPVPPTRPSTAPFPTDTTRRRAPRAPGDTTRSDTTRAPKQLVTWEPDSVMSALLQRPAYTATYYKGKDATLDARDHALTLSGKAAVQREQTVLVADTIVYNDSTRMMLARSPVTDTIVLRDPSQGSADLLAQGRLEYDLRRRRGIVTNLATSSAQAGQTWYVAGHEAVVRGDSTARGSNTSYAEEASITSCDLTEPHYHFQAKEVKMISKRILVARPAVLYVADIPVMWLPFIFQDMRSGRRSGLIPPRFGISDIVRTSPSYRRSIENLGYYFAINDYMDAQVSFDWRSGNVTESNPGDFGWTRWNGEWRYRWLDRFLGGSVRTTYEKLSTGDKDFRLSWAHSQQFSQNSSLNSNINYSSNTMVYRASALTVAQALAAISSQLNFQQKLGAANFTIGGSRQQYSGRSLVNQDFPNFNFSTQPLNLASWLVWTPQFSLDNQQAFHLETAPIIYTPRPGGGADTVRSRGDTRTTSITFQTPFRLGRFNLSNAFRISDREDQQQTPVPILDFQTGAQLGTRVYGSTFRTDVYWDPQFSLPGLLQGSWNISPFVSIVNSNGSAGYWVRSFLSNGQWVHQSKTLQYGISASPTFFGFFPGFGPFSRFRHSLQPRISFSYAPASNVSDDFLRAINATRFGYLGGLRQEQIQFQLNQVLEAKVRSRADTAPEAGQKLRILSLNTSPLTYDFEIARRTHRFGLTNNTFSINAQSDLLPGFDFSTQYSLFQGDPLSDTAKFKPFRTGLTASFTLGRKNNPFATLQRLFGRAVTPDSGAAGTAADVAAGQGLNSNPPIAGATSSRYPLGVNTSQGWTLSLSYTSSRSRPVTGSTVQTLDPKKICAIYQNFPSQYVTCLRNPPAQDTLSPIVGGAPIFVSPAQSTLRANMAFNVTPKWAMQWTTGYDFERHEFSDHVVSLQRDLHDWRAIFAFTQAPNGNFAFNFFISLIAEPDLKFDYNRQTYRPQTTP
jgi:hypothetical protein